VAISIVQSAWASGLGGGGSFGAGATLGNWLVIAQTGYNNSTPPPTNTAAPTLGGITSAVATQLLYEASPNTANNVSLAFWLLQVTSAIAGQTAVNTTWDTGNAAGFVAYETTGWTGTPALDQSSSDNGTGTAVTSLTTPAIQYAPELVIGTLISYGQTQGSPAGYTNNNSSANGFQATGYQIVTSSGGTYTYAATAGGSANWAAGIVTIGVATGAAFTAAPNRPRGQAVNRASTY
jgi:hypothetical protein